MKRRLAFVLLITLLVSALAVPAGATSVTPQAAPLVTQSAGTNGMVRVWLSSIRNAAAYNLTLSGSYMMNGQTLASGSQVKVEFSGGAVYVTANGVRTNMGTSVTLARLSGGVQIAESLAPGNTYPGDFRFFISSGVQYVVCTLFIEDYVYGVLPYEMDNSFPLEALKAQAVAARTYAVRVKTASGNYDVTDTINHQVFRGVNYSKTRCIQATDETRGVVMTYGGRYIEANFGASNGGQTELNSNAWGSTRAGYLQIKDDPYDLANPQSITKSYMIYRTPQQGSSVSAYAMIREALAGSRGGFSSNYNIEEVTDVTLHTPKYASPSRLYTRMAVTVRYNGGQLTTVDIPVFPTVKSSLGLSINSTDNELFTVTAETGGFRVQARRYGHGVGMSQRGAQQMANQGFDFRQILGFYYTGIQLLEMNFVASWDGGSGTTPPAGETTPPVTVETEGRVSLSNPSSRLNLRQAPSIDGQVLARLSHGANVTVLTEEGTWYKVRYGTLVGYVAKEYIILDTLSPGGGTTPSVGNAYITLQGGILNIRAEARAASAIVGSVSNGVLVQVLEKGETWSKIQHGSITGYVLTVYLSFANETPSAGDDGVALVSLTNPNETLNLRMTASLSAPVLKKLANGTALMVLERGASWTKVSTQGLIGYVLNTYIVFADQGTSPSTPTPAPTTNPSTTQTWQGVVSLSSGTLNLRSQPNTSALIVASLPNYAIVTVTQLGDTWCAIRYGALEGYVMRRYLAIDLTGNPAPTAIPSVSPTATPSSSPAADTKWVKTSSGSGVNLRRAPSTNGSVIRSIPYGAAVTVIEPDKEWAYVTYASEYGYVASSYLVDENPLGTDSIQPGTPTAVPTGDSYLYVKTASGGPVNLRRDASGSSGIITTVAHGTRVLLLEKGSAWTYVSTGDAAGYIATQYLSDTEPAFPGSGGTQPSTSGGALNKGTVRLRGSAISISLFAEAKDDAAITAVLADGEPVDVLRYDGTAASWVYVKSGEAAGYAPRESFRLDYGVAVVSLPSLDGMMIVHASPDELSDTVTLLQQGSVVTILADVDGQWAQVRTSDGKTGYAFKGSLSTL